MLWQRKQPKAARFSSLDWKWENGKQALKAKKGGRRPFTCLEAAMVLPSAHFQLAQNGTKKGGKHQIECKLNEN